MVGCLSIIGYVILAIWMWATYGFVPGIGVGILGFILLNLAGPLIDKYIDTGGQAKAEATYERKLQHLMARYSGSGGLPDDLAFLFACTILPPQKTLLARSDRVTRKIIRSYLRQIRDIANASPHWQLPIPEDATDILTDDCLNRLDKYRMLGEAHNDTYLQDWVERRVNTYRTWYDD